MADAPLPAAALAELTAAEAVLGDVLPLADATPAAVAALQGHKWAALAGFAARHVPYYRRLGLPSAPALSEFPPIDKAKLMYGLPDTVAAPGPTLERLRSLVPADERVGTSDLFRGRSYVLRTSGTTGFVGFFLWDAAMAAVAEASATRFLPAPADLPKPVVAVAPVVLWHPLRGPLEGLYSIPFGAGLDGTVERLRTLRPRTIMGSTGFMAALAEEQIAGRLDIAPEVVILGAEQATPLQWQRVTRAWGVTPAMQYGLSEAGLIASRCPAGNWHLHADTVVVELLDAAGAPAAEGRPCARALVTRLFGPEQPIIRYELGDEIVPGPAICPCGGPFPTLAAIGGRRRAVLWLRGQDGGAVSVSASAVIAALETTPGLMRYQIRYERPDLIEVALLVEGPLDTDARAEAIRATLRSQGALPPRVRVVPGSVPDVWAAPAGAKEHHVRLSVTREAVLASAPAGG